MISLSAEDAILLVRKNLDEVQGNDSDMAGLDDIDSNNFEEIVCMTFPDAINDVNLSAPSSLLSGEVMSSGDLAKVDYEDGVLDIPVSDFLRLVAFQPTDSSYSVDTPVAEHSAEGRMQLNRYTKATPDRPVLVKVQSINKDETNITGYTHFRYYGLSSAPTSPYSSAIKVFRYVKRCKYDKPVSATAMKSKTYNVSELLADATIDRLTGMVARIFNDSRADYFLARSSFQEPEVKTNEK